MSEPYGWIITEDHLYESDTTDTFKDGAGTMGPSNCTFTAQAILKFGEEFQMLDGDNEVYYTGKLLGGNGFEPLDDFGRGDSGCTTITFLKDGEWVVL